MKKHILFLSIAAMLSGCGEPAAPNADQHQAEVTAKMAAEADRAVPVPAIVNWAEKHMVHDLYELRDKQVPTWAYMQGIDGRLICLGRSVGYGIPYAVQFSNPQVYSRHDCGEHYCDGPMPQPEPNGLFMPDNAEGTWLQMLDPATNTVEAVYVEPRVTVSPFRLTGPVVAQDCTADKPTTK
jgi:hypothetical protein